MKAQTIRRINTRRDEARALFRNAILEAAEQIFAERGFHGTRIQDIAERARIGVGTVYNHFDEKEELLRALVDERTDEMLAHLAGATADDEPRDFAARLERRIARMLGFVEQHRGFFAIVMECGLVASGPPRGSERALGPRSMKRIDRFRSTFRALVQDGMDSGALAAHDPGHLAAFLGGTIRAFTFGALFDQDTSLVEKAPTIVELFLHGAAGGPAPAPRRKP
jgi:AcrR family transcriptional regulator